MLMAAASATASSALPARNLRCPRAHQLAPCFLSFASLSGKSPQLCVRSYLHIDAGRTRKTFAFPANAEAAPSSTAFHGACFVLGDNIDTDQIIPAEYLTLVPSNPDEYVKLGSYALSGLPNALYPTRFAPNQYLILIAGANFGCGSSREHAPVALGAAGVRAVVAESYARIFFRNSVATGEIYPLEAETMGVWTECKTGDIITIDLEESVLINHRIGKQYKLKPIGDAGPVIDAGGIFAYARKTGMISSSSP